MDPFFKAHPNAQPKKKPAFVVNTKLTKRQLKRQEMENLARSCDSIVQEMKSTKRPMGQEAFQILVVQSIQQIANSLQVALSDE